MGCGMKCIFSSEMGCQFLVWCGKCNSIILNNINNYKYTISCVCVPRIGWYYVLSGHVGSVWILKGRISCELFGPTMNHNTLWTVGSDWHMAQGWNAILEATESWARIRPQNVWIWLCLKIRFTKKSYHCSYCIILYHISLKWFWGVSVFWVF